MNTIKKIGQLYLNHRFLYNLGILLVLFFAHCFWGNMMYIVFPILALMMLLDSLENGVSYLVFSMPFCFLNLYISSILFLVCCLICIGKFYFIRFFKEKQKPKLILLIPILVFIVYCVMPIGTYSLNTLISMLIFISVFVVACIIATKPEVIRIHFNLKVLCFAILFATLFGMTYYCSPYLKSFMVVYYVNGNWPRLMALFPYANVLSMFCELILSFLAYYIISKNFTKVDVLLFIAIGGIGLLTFSKSFMLVFSVILLILIICLLCRSFKKTAIITLVVAGVCVAIGLIFPQIIKPFIDRFIGSINECQNAQDIMNMITTQRFDLWIEYAHYIAQNPLVLFFGRGLGAPVLSTLSPHNGYLSSVYKLGIVGLALLGVAVFFIIRQFLKSGQRKIHWAIFVPILVVGMMLFVEDLIFYIFV